MTAALTIALYGLRESMRRRVFTVVLLLTAGFLGLYALGANEAFDTTAEFAGELPVEERDLTGSTLLGLAMFATLFLGAVLAAFLTLGVVRGDAERGLLQPLVVRPVGRRTLLLARFAAAATVAGVYTLVVYFAALLLTNAVGGWWPDHAIRPGLSLAAAVIIVSALSVAGSVVMTSTANGIAVFMLYGAGLTAGLLGQIGEAINSGSLERVAEVASWALPFEALYQDALQLLVADAGGLTGAAIELGPFGGAQGAGPLLWPWAVAYTAAVLAVAVALFRRRDL